jgi:hypothetical protein
MSIVLLGSTSGSCTLQEQAVAGTTVLTLPTTSGTVLTTASTGISASNITTGTLPFAQLPSGSVLQVVQERTSASNVFSGTVYKATNVSATITPKFSTSKILILISGGNWDTQNAGYQAFGTIFRNSTNILTSGQASFTDVFSPAARLIAPVVLQCLDSPATTSATSYTLYFNSGGGSNIVQYNTQGSTGVIILMEIAG